MEIITTTDLRTKSSQLVQKLEKGGEVALVHRSRIVGVIKPANENEVVFSAEKFRKVMSSFPKLKYISPDIRKKLYRKHLEKKYGKDISRHE